MNNRFLTTGLLLLLGAIATLAPVQAARAMTAEQYFADGNRLFRDDLYWAALLRYSQARDEGMDTPLLHYNMGVAHYRAGQYVRAREALQQAATDPALAVAAHYNLGLNAWALGETDEALRWFRLVRDQDENARLQSFAVVAISRIRDSQAQPDEYRVLVAEREEKRNFTDLYFRTTLGYGTDDNVYRSPAAPYIDYADPALPIVIPEVQSGAFIPVALAARYTVNSLPFEGFFGFYRFAGRYYLDQNLENGNEQFQELGFGSEYRRSDENQDRWVRSAFTIAQHDEIYYDPDNGAARTIGGEEAEDRMNYLRYGPELNLRQSWERVTIGGAITGQLWNYEQTNVLPEYDHEYFLFGIFGQYDFSSSTLLRLTAEYSSRRFGDRPSYDLDGQQRIGNPSVRYDYGTLRLRARQRIMDDMWAGLDVERTVRTDEYVGYNDYTRDSVAFEFHWSPGARFDLEATAVYRLYDFPNAFAFNNPIVGNKTQESAWVGIIGIFRITPHWSVVGEARFRETVSNDLRIQYESNQYILGIRWER